jgi:hypothetical protein
VSLSWGHRPPSDSAEPRRIHVGFALVLVGIVAIAGADGWVGPPPIGDAERAAIETTLLEHAVALNKRDLSGFRDTLDRTRVSFGNCQDVLFRSLPDGVRVRGPVLGSVERYRDYLRAWVSDGVDWRRQYFRQVGDRWLLSEPLAQDLGAERTAVYGGVDLLSWAIDDDVVGLIGAALPDVRDFVVRHAKTSPTGRFTVRVDQLADPTGGAACLYEGSASVAYRGSTTRIVLREVRLTSSLGALSPHTLTTLRHEALHWVQFDYSADAVRHMDWWLIEGWPYFLTEPTSAYDRRMAFCRDSAVAGSLRAGPSRGATYEELARDYVLAGAAVEYLEKTYGPDAYWNMVDEFRTGSNAKNPYVAAIDTDPATFFDRWVSWMKERYC